MLERVGYVRWYRQVHLRHQAAEHRHRRRARSALAAKCADISSGLLVIPYRGDVGPALGRPGWRSWRSRRGSRPGLLKPLPLDYKPIARTIAAWPYAPAGFRQIYQQLKPLMF